MEDFTESRPKLQRKMIETQASENSAFVFVHSLGEPSSENGGVVVGLDEKPIAGEEAPRKVEE